MPRKRMRMKKKRRRRIFCRFHRNPNPKKLPPPNKPLGEKGQEEIRKIIGQAIVDAMRR